MTNKRDYTVADCEYQVGDMVIVSNGVKECAYSTSSDMLAQIGQQFEVRSVQVSDRKRCRFLIRLKDSGGWAYDERCFEPPETKGRTFDDGDITLLF